MDTDVLCRAYERLGQTCALLDRDDCKSAEDDCVVCVHHSLMIRERSSTLSVVNNWRNWKAIFAPKSPFDPGLGAKLPYPRPCLLPEMKLDSSG